MQKLGLASLVGVMVLGVGIGRADNLTVGYSSTITPDPELSTFVGELRALAGPAKKSSIRKVEKFFAPSVKAYTRSLDPFQPWNEWKVLKSEFLSGTADVMVEQGELAAGMKVPDYRINAMQQIAALIPEGGTYGILKDFPGAICAPAAYAVDREAAAKFAGKFELNAYSLRFHREAVGLHPKPGSAGLSAILEPYTLMMFDYKPGLPAGWSYYETSDGTKGYMQERADSFGLSQHHVCFARVKGKYRITAVFGYGL